MLKSYWVVVVVAVVGGGLQDCSVSPRPLGFGFLGLGLRGLGPGLDNISVIFLPGYARSVGAVPLVVDNQLQKISKEKKKKEEGQLCHNN